jgi:hypothetical protein
MHSTGSRVQGAMDSAQSARRAVSERWDSASHTARDQARRARDEFSVLMEEQPLLMGAIGLAVGATVAALMPGTRRERDLMGGASQSFTDKASELASEGYETFRESASETVDDLARSVTGRETSGGGAASVGDGATPGSQARTEWSSSESGRDSAAAKDLWAPEGTDGTGTSTRAGDTGAAGPGSPGIARPGL